jgi:ATP-dependent RNA helicase DBP3
MPQVIEDSVKPKKHRTAEEKKLRKEKKRASKEAADKKQSKKARVDETESDAKTSDKWIYHPSKKSLMLDDAVISDFLSSNEITITPKNDFKPILKFSHVDFPQNMSSALSGFEKPTAIQSVTWPPILSGRDLIGIAATGSGKTLAFGIPAFLRTYPDKKPRVLVLSPTRELAMQIQEQFETLGKNLDLESVVIYGGVSKHDQKRALKSASVIVATPGRLLDLIETDRACDLSLIEYFVLDEADRMLDFGFEEAIRKIVSYLPVDNRQTVMFSATWPTTIQAMAANFLKNPVHVTVGSLELSANTSIEQRVEVLDPYAKESRLLALLKNYHSSRKNRILIFALYKKEAARLEAFLKRNGYKVGAIHGDLAQAQRTSAIEGFKSGQVPLLIATDVAARGIDIPNVGKFLI